VSTINFVVEYIPCSSSAMKLMRRSKQRFSSH
jgi:hypothetical protein